VIFRTAGDYQAFVDVLREACGKFSMRLIAFCVMPNHWHLLLWPDKDVSLSAFMHWLTSTHVRRYHAFHGLVGTGHLYQARYRNHICDDERRLLATIRYVEGNPLRANLVRRARDWKWGSHWMRSCSGEEDFLTPCPIELPRNWEHYVDTTSKPDRRRRKKDDRITADSSFESSER
jgi:putative transposase